MADQISFTPLRAIDRNCDPVPAAQARFYQSGTTTLQTVYSDSAGTVPHADPLVADGRGVFPQVFSNVSLKVIVTDAAGTVLPGFPIDPAPRTQINAAGAGSVTFSPTVEIPVEDVQSAIERVQVNIATSMQGFGLGVTGGAAALSNLDATATPSGQYRITAATTGTFPAGMVAADGGIVQFARETAAAASQTVFHGATERRATRDLVAGVWGTWREDLTVNQTLVAGDTIYHGGTNFARLPKGTAGQSLVMNSAGTLPEWGGIFSKSYESPATVVALNTLYTFTHGLGGLPKLVCAFYVCKLAINGYAVGDYVPILSGTENYNNDVAPAIVISATEIKVRTGADALMRAIGINGAARDMYLPANFNLVVRAFA